MSKKRSVLKDLFEISSILPPWVGIVLALVSFVAFSYLAGQEIETPLKTTGSALPIVPIMIKTFSTFGMFIFPGVFLIGSAASAFQHAQRRDLFKKANVVNARTAVNNMSWREFEMLVGENFRKQGFAVTETPSGPDGGVDLVLKNENKKILVQCKHWQTTKIGVSVVRELYGILVDSRADEVNIICSGEFTEEAKAFVRNKPIHLINGDELMKLIHETG